MGPGQNPQYTGAPKAGGGCGLLAKSTTTSPMAQPQCSNENSNNVNKLRNQSSIMQEDYEESISLTLRTRSSRKPKNARRKLETPMAPATPCKTCKKNKHGKTRSKTNDFKSQFACILEASESTRMRMEETLPKCHEDHIAGKGDNSQQYYNREHKFIPMPQAMKIPAAKAAVDKEWENL